MSAHQLDEERIFHLARQIPRTAARDEYLDQICAGDHGLHERIEALLAVHEQEAEFLKSSPDVRPTVDYTPVTETPGQQIGRFKLLQKIGEGGFGVVYMAEQVRPVRRKVALKIIKPGMDTNAVIARFEAERQALALMDHPNISRVLDGGTTDSGRPYFVMELVKGVPITEYCDKNHLPTSERLELFTTICQAVQHAHQKGIIHRDLKPSNILVTLADGKPVVKVIDFGVSKALNQQLTEKTLFTAYGQMIGTPQYMSPEQAEMSCLDVDTRSDIYSLGVLLYELLTGTTPFEGERLRTAGYAEMQRIIQEEEPPKPSVRLSSAGGKVTVVAKHRSATPERLHKSVKGDLDLIVMKALEKERSRRYESASRFAEDLQRFLNNQLVEARPPSSLYRFRKFYERNRVVTASGIAIALILLASTITLSIMTASLLRRNQQVRDLLYEQAVFAAVLSSSSPQAEEALDRARRGGVSPERLRFVEGVNLFYGGELEKAIDVLTPCKGVGARSLLAMAYYYSDQGEQESYSRIIRELSENRSEQSVGGSLDRLFFGYALTHTDPVKGERVIREVAEEKPTWVVAQLNLAGACGMLAIHYNRDEYAREALERVQRIDYTVDGFALGRAISLWIYCVAIEFGVASDDESARIWKRATELADSVAPLESQLAGQMVAVGFYARKGNEESLTRLTEVVNPMEASHPVRNRAIAALFGAGNDVAALQLASGDSDAATIAKAFILFSHPEQRPSLVHDLREIARTTDSQHIQVRAVQALLALRVPEARKEITFTHDDDKTLRAMGKTVEFLVEGIDEHTYELSAHGRGFEECMAYFNIALTHLATGRDANARKCFQKCLDTHSFTHDEYHWAKGFLGQWE